MGYVFRLEDAHRYQDWLATEPGRSAAAIEKEVLRRVWSPVLPQTVLEVGCGTGLFLEWLAGFGHQVTGLEPSPHMLEIARKRIPPRVSLDRGFAEDLPYEDNAFDTVALITTLEFVDHPRRAVEEACRVARRHVLLGVLNKYSIISVQRCIESLWRASVYRKAKFFGVLELQHLVADVLSGPVPMKWRTCLCFPLVLLRYLRFIERSRFLHWQPFGHFIAMRIDMSYPMRTIQDPLLHDLPSSVARPGFHASCWLSTPPRRGHPRDNSHPHGAG
ncbi:MAG: methyltransferase domain-containing protein [Syntrophobacteraceae bacterium]|nr:methyltransferase domain-containing protein [Syntrophobacteraceae bacterium]